jgi:hypothetical protein
MQVGDMEQRLIPLSDAAKTKVDVAAIGTAMASFFKAIPWPELAACAAFIYTALRILEMVWGWNWKRKK